MKLMQMFTWKIKLKKLLSFLRNSENCESLHIFMTTFIIKIIDARQKDHYLNQNPSTSITYKKYSKMRLRCWFRTPSLKFS